MRYLLNYIEAFVFILIFGVGNVVKWLWDSDYEEMLELDEYKDLINRQLDIE